MDAQIEVAGLSRLLYNAKLYSHKKSEARGETLWAWGAWGLRVIASDDFVILTDTLMVDFGKPGWGVLEYAYMLELEKQLREWPDDTIDGNTVAWTEVTEPESELLYEADAMVFAAKDSPPIPLLNWAVHPDRLRKLSLVKPGEYPIDIQAYAVNDGQDDVVGFKIGPTVQGLIDPLNRKIARETVPEGSMW